jgi:hypothetical protein
MPKFFLGSLISIFIVSDAWDRLLGALRSFSGLIVILRRGSDEPENLTYTISSFCPRGTDGDTIDNCASCHPNEDPLAKLGVRSAEHFYDAQSFALRRDVL